MKQAIRGNKRSKEEGIRIMKDIFDLLPKHNDYEIMNTLGIPNSTYYRYKSKIYREAKKSWQQICTESLEYRALQIKKSMDLCIKVNEDIATDPNQPAKDRIEASLTMLDAQLNILQLLIEGPEYIQKLPMIN